MICDGITLEDGGQTRFDIVIVGAGAVGIALATQLAGQAGSVALIEAGDATFRPSDNLDFFKAEQVDDPRHAPGELYRRRMLGGTTSVWGGRCIPFDPEDFAPAQHRPGWPITYAQFSAHLPRALEFLDAGPPDFSIEATRSEHRLPPDRASSDLVLDRIERYSKPTNVWQKWRESLGQSVDVTVFHNVACSTVFTDASDTRAAGIELRTRSNRRHTIAAATVILACGGLETPRLLLSSRDRRPLGLGNARDLVGRHYMAHLVSSADNAGLINFANPSAARAFDFAQTGAGVYVRRLMLLSPETRARGALPNIAFRPTRPAMDDTSHHNAVLSAMFLVRNAFIPPEYMRSMGTRLGHISARTWRAHAKNIAADLPGLMSFGINWVRRRILPARKLPSIFLYQGAGTYPLEFNAEQLPNPESRVLLGAETDPFGMPRLIVKWRFHAAELASICRAYDVLGSAFTASGLGTVSFGPDLRETVGGALVPQGGHHIGTTKMGVDPASGVTDENCEVWDTNGLFIAGTAVLPTSSFANPTLTAVALAFRLGEYLIRRHDKRPTNAGTREPVTTLAEPRIGL